MEKNNVSLLISLILVPNTPTPPHTLTPLWFTLIKKHYWERDLPPSPPQKYFTQTAGERGLWFCVYCGILAYLRMYMSSSIKHLYSPVTSIVLVNHSNCEVILLHYNLFKV